MLEEGHEQAMLHLPVRGEDGLKPEEVRKRGGGGVNEE